MCRLHLCKITAAISKSNLTRSYLYYVREEHCNRNLKLVTKSLVKFLLHVKRSIFISGSAGDVPQPTQKEG